MAETQDSLFTLRRDRNGVRVVYNLGNERGDCPWHCTFCDVGRSPKVSSEWNIAEFDRQHAQYRGALKEHYHPLIYNQGNVTNPTEFSPQTLDHILAAFANDPLVQFVSLNSREAYVTRALLDSMIAMGFPFPIHFIFGVESFSSRAPQIFGKDTRGELERFIAKLRPYNSAGSPLLDRRGYAFGIDANLVLLPEMYLEPGERRIGNEERIAEGFRSEVAALLSVIDDSVPVEINLHPYHRVESLPYEDLNLDLLVGILPELQALVDSFNDDHPAHPTHLFVGIEGSGFDSAYQVEQRARWKELIETFNQTGRCTWLEA